MGGSAQRCPSSKLTFGLGVCLSYWMDMEGRRKAYVLSDGGSFERLVSSAMAVGWGDWTQLL